MRSKHVFVLLLVVIVSILLVSTVAAEETVHKGEIVQFSGDVHLTPHERVSGDVVLFSGDAHIEGVVENDVVCFAGDIFVNGEIHGDAVAISGTITRGPEGIVGGNEITLENAMDIGHMGSAMIRTGHWEGFSPLFTLGFRLLGLIGFAALGVLVTVLLPNPVQNMGDYLEKNLLISGLVGVGAFVVLPFALLILIISVIGIPLIPFFLLAFVLVGLYGYFGVAHLAGEKISRAFKLSTSPVLHVILGILVFWLILRIPLLSILIWLLLAIFSFGTVLGSKFGTLRAWFTQR